MITNENGGMLRMKKTNKIIAGILAGAMMLSCVSVGAESTNNYSVTVNAIDKSIGIVIDDNETVSTQRKTERINESIPDYKDGQKAQRLTEFTVSKGETAYLKFDMIDGGTGEDTCDITLTEKVSENEKTIETVVATIENLKLKSTLRIKNLSPDKKYYFTVQSKTKSGNASFLFWTNTEVKFDLQPSDNNVNNLVEVVIPNQTIGVDNSEWVSASEWDECFETLKEYGIFVGDENGDTAPYNILTRAEAAKALCVALGINPETLTQQKFSDVDETHWAYNYINVLADLGIISGTGNNLFEPDREITYDEIVKMLVNTLGYEHKANATGGYPDGYIQTASSIGLTKDMEIAVNEPCRRYIAFTLFYNALDMPFLVRTGFGSEEEYAVADGKDGRDYMTLRYRITGEKN